MIDKIFLVIGLLMTVGLFFILRNVLRQVRAESAKTPPQENEK